MKMTKHKSKKPKLEKQRTWDDSEDKSNPGSVSAILSTIQDDNVPKATTSQLQSKTRIFTSEVEAMLYAYGDVRHPLAETVSLVEDIVRTQMCELLKAGAAVAEWRSSRELGLEEFLFLLRKDSGKLSRFVNRMKFLDSHSKLVAGSSVNVKMEDFPEIQAEDEDIVQSVVENKSLKRWNTCIDFLNFIDDSGELTNIVVQLRQDDVKVKRLERAERQTREMSSDEYLHYVKCRQITFAQQGSGRKKFREWFDFDSLQIDAPLSKYGWDAMEYLAQETVADLVDLCLLVRSETMQPLLPCEIEPDSRHLPLYASSSFAARAEVLRAQSSETGDSEESQESTTKRKVKDRDLNRKLALKPSHVREAMRRMNSNPTKAFLSKAVNVSLTLTKLLCLP